MNRRRFLKLLGIGSAVVVAAPALIEALPETPVANQSFCYDVIDMDAPQVATIGEWKDYFSMTDPDLQVALDEYERQHEQGKHHG